MVEAILKENWPIFAMFGLVILLVLKVARDRSRMRGDAMRIDAMMFLASAGLVLAIIAVGVDIVVNHF